MNRGETMVSSREMAQMTFGDPGLFDFFGGIAKTIAPALPIISKVTRFIPFVGPVISTIADIAADAIPAGDVETSDERSADYEDFGDDEI